MSNSGQWLLRFALISILCLVLLAEIPEGLDQETDVIEEQEIFWKPGTDEYYGNGQLRKCKLDEPQKINGLLCQSWIRFYDDGSIKDCELSKAVEIFEGKTFPEGTRIFYSESGLLRHAWLGEDVVFDGLHIKGGYKIDTGFHPDGNLRTVYLDEPAVIDSIPAEPSMFFAVRCHENGRLKSCKLDDKVTHRGPQYKKGLFIELDNKGDVTSVEKKSIFDL